jgi:DUF4097 and DUF4098 domain-containing protein YvlB
MTTYQTPHPVRLRLKLEAGRIDVISWDEPRSQVDVTPLGADQASIEAAENVQQELRGSGDSQELSVESPSGRSLFGLRRGPELRFAISVPHGSSIDAATVSAGVTGRGRFGTAKVNTTSGDVSLGAVAGDASVKTVSGDLDVERVDGKASLNSVSGDLELGPVAGEISANTVSGDLHVTSAGSSVNAKGVSGDVTVESVRRGEARLQSVSGDITLGVAVGARVWMDVSSMSGNTQSDLEPDDAAAGDDVDLRIKANSASGDIRLQRAAPVTSA